MAPQASDGRATAITVLTPIKPRWTAFERVLFFLAEHIKAFNRGVDELSFIHYARWTIVRGFPSSGRGQQRQKLHYNYLFFETNFNGTWDEYIDVFSQVIPRRMKAIWGTSYGFPGPRPVAPFKSYIHANDLPIAHYYGAYPEASTKMVISALSVRTAFEDFRARAAGISDPDEFRRAYEEFLTGIQHDL